jgi:hypothetical protein
MEVQHNNKPADTYPPAQLPSYLKRPRYARNLGRFVSRPINRDSAFHVETGKFRMMGRSPLRPVAMEIILVLCP